MSVISIPSLSTNGWISEVSAKLDYELGCMACTDPLQSNSFARLTSFSGIIQTFKGDIPGTTAALREAIATKLSRVFSEVDVTASFELVDPTESKTLSKITLSINFKEDGKVHTASRILMFYNGKFKEIMEANNG